MTSTSVSTATQVYRIWIKASRQKVWDAITDSDWNGRYGYGAAGAYDLRPGGSYLVRSTPEMIGFGAPEVMVEGEVVELEPPRLLVQTWHALFDEATTAEPATRLVWELVEEDNGATRLTLTHETAEAPATAIFTSGDAPGGAGGGWPFILSDLKTLLETGATMAGGA